MKQLIEKCYWHSFFAWKPVTVNNEKHRFKMMMRKGIAIKTVKGIAFEYQYK